MPHFDLSTVAPRNSRINNGNEGQVLYGILLSNEQLFVGQWPKGQIKKCEAHYYDPARKTPHPREYSGKGAALILPTVAPRDHTEYRSLKDKYEAGYEGKSYLAGIMATDNVTVTDT